MKAAKEHKPQQSRVIQKVQMSSEKIQELKELPYEFEGITLYHGDNRNYLGKIELSTVNTLNWEDEFLRSRILENINSAVQEQSSIYDIVEKLSEDDFNSYIFNWIHSPNTGFIRDGKELIKPNGFFNGCCCCMERDQVKMMDYIYEITINDKFQRVKPQTVNEGCKNALYKGNNGVRLQFAEVTSNQGEVDILSKVPQESINLIQTK